ncbi:hypothetical protein NIES2104_29210 [Leptolyngbya sp. NIES-2104]|nr:hypothetical protein NIES2104_29210 [Leptolyngbya sp. NIES-2104]
MWKKPWRESLRFDIAAELAETKVTIVRNSIGRGIHDRKMSIRKGN